MGDPVITLAARPERVDEITDPAYEPYVRLRKLVWPGMQILDVGCGNGKIGDYLQKAGAVVDGIEPADSRIAVARTRLRYVSDQWAGPSFSDPVVRSDYDLVTFLDVLEHIPDPQPVMEWSVTRLAPGGAVVALIPNSAHWSFRAKILRGDWRYEKSGLFDRTHLRFFDPDTMGLLCPDGLEEVSRFYSAFGRSLQPRIVRFRPRLLAHHVLLEWRRPVERT